LRKLAIGAITGALFFVIVGVALALTNNTVNYTSTVTGKAKKAGTNTAYTGILDVGTSDNTQPNTAPLTDVFFAKQIKNNSTKFPSCTPADIDGKSSVPAKCKKAVVGSGSASSKIGQPGQPPAVTEDLTVTAYNGSKGKAILLVLNGTSPAPISNRVINGKITKFKSGAFGYKVGFAVPKDLQQQLGAQIALTHFNVKINTSKKVKVKKGKKKVAVSYLQLTGCPSSKKLPVKTTVHFNQDNGDAGGPVVTDTDTMACK
jgi:hypothetical protein